MLEFLDVTARRPDQPSSSASRLVVGDDDDDVSDATGGQGGSALSAPIFSKKSFELEDPVVDVAQGRLEKQFAVQFDNLRRVWGGKEAVEEELKLLESSRAGSMDKKNAAEESAGFFSSILYLWVSPFLKMAASENLPLSALPPPVGKYASGSLGRTTSLLLLQQHKDSHCWDALVGNNVYHKRDASSRGLLRFVGKHPFHQGRISVLVEWQRPPKHHSKAHADSGDVFHNGTVEGVLLCPATEANATLEDARDVVPMPFETTLSRRSLDTRQFSRSGGGSPPIPPPPSPCSVSSAILSVSVTDVVSQFPIRFVADCCTLANPVALEYFVKFLMDGDATWSRGLIIVGIIFALATVQTLFIQKYYQICTRTGLMFRNAVTAAVFSKCFTISSKSLSLPEMNPGRVVNMVTNDAERVNTFWVTAADAFSAPFQVIVCIGLLYRLVGWVAFAALGVLMITVPIDTVILRKLTAAQVLQSRAMDQRIRYTVELLVGIRLVKFMGWEPKFLSFIFEKRRLELIQLRAVQAYRIASGFVSFASPKILVAVVFIVYYAQGGTVTPDIVFPTINILSIIRVPFMSIPTFFYNFSQYRVSMKRLTKFFECEDAVNAVEEIPSRWADRYAVMFDAATVTAFVPRLLCSAASSATGEDVYALDEKVLLSDIKVYLPRGKLTVIVGATGCGKSTLLTSILGTLHVSEGHLLAEKDVTIVPQQPWIMNATFRDNIVFFEEPFDASRYQWCLEACSLNQDLRAMPNGEQTEIGEKGVNISGGQKARINLARALYTKKKLYLLDDPLSALDATVSDSVMRNAILSDKLTGTTRVLATHQLQVLPLADYIVVLDKCLVVFAGSFQEYESSEAKKLLTESAPKKGPEGPAPTSPGGVKAPPQKPPVPQQLIVPGRPPETKKRFNSKSSIAESARTAMSRITFREDVVDSADSASGAGAADVSRRSFLSIQKLSRRKLDDDRITLRQSDSSGDDDDIRTILDEATAQRFDGELEKDKQKKKLQAAAKSTSLVLPKDSEKYLTERGRLIAAEEKAVGAVPWRVYIAHFQACGGIGYAFLVLLIFAITEGLNAFNNLWLSFWSINKFNLEPSQYAYWYGIIVAVGTISTPLRFYAAYTFMNRGSQSLHNDMLKSVATAPVSFFDMTPFGRIINRFTRDIGMLDISLQLNYVGFLQCIFFGIASVAISVGSQPLGLVPVVPCTIVYFWLMKYLTQANREIRRMTNLASSPVYSLLGEVISGSKVIVTFRKEHAVLREALRRIDVTYSTSYVQNLCNRWLSLRLDMLGNVMVVCVALAGVIGKMEKVGPQDVGLLGLALTMAMCITVMLNLIIKQTAAVEADMSNVERLVFYGKNIVTEDMPELPGLIASCGAAAADEATGSPAKRGEAGGSGKDPQSVANAFAPREAPEAIEWRHVSLRYRPTFPIVLSDVSFQISPREKVGIVGRTGSGKSTMLLALLRIVEIESGTISIGRTSTKTLSLRETRGKFALIPQDPVMFDGTVRSNLDPFAENTDDRIWAVLELIGMKDRVQAQGSGLLSGVAPGGQNYSVGERQLLCLARALLKTSASYVMMDEATANVDQRLDELLQVAIRTALKHHTVITIAHRLRTIIDFDRVIVMDGGKVSEIGTPLELIKKEGGAFKALVAAQGPEEQAALVAMASKRTSRKQ